MSDVCPFQDGWTTSVCLSIRINSMRPEWTVGWYSTSQWWEFKPAWAKKQQNNNNNDRVLYVETWGSRADLFFIILCCSAPEHLFLHRAVATRRRRLWLNYSQWLKRTKSGPAGPVVSGTETHPETLNNNNWGRLALFHTAVDEMNFVNLF